MSRRRIRLGWVVYVYVCSFYGVRNWKNKYNRPTLISSQLVDSLLEESKRPSYMTSHNQSVATENELYQGRNPLTPDQPQEDFLCESPRQNKNVLLPSTISNNISNIDDIATNFLWMSTLFAANHGCVVACLSLATARLGGAVGAWQSGLLYAVYTVSGLVGSTYVVKELGSRNAIIAGMTLYCFYVSAFWLATVVPSWSSVAAATGAVLGGMGAGFLWTAQGAFFAQSAAALAAQQQQRQREEPRLATPVTGVAGRHDTNTDDPEDAATPFNTSPSRAVGLEAATTRLASIFAVIYLTSEVGLRALSSVLIGTAHFSWSTIFAIYALVALVSTILMVSVKEQKDENSDNEGTSVPQSTQPSVWYKLTAAWQLLVNDGKMKYMIGLNAVFGVTSSFLTSYVNGQVVHRVVGSDTFVGLFTAWVSCVAAVSSVAFGRIQGKKGSILIAGAICFSAVATPFLAYPDFSQWSWHILVFVYTMHGVGRATFEGTLKALFADYFSYEKEGAFANIIVQNGMSSSIGFLLTFSLICSEKQQIKWGDYCVMYRDGSVHDVFSFELLIIAMAVLAIAGYCRASTIHKKENNRSNFEETSLLHSEQA